jgi:hypothetical protein
LHKCSSALEIKKREEERKDGVGVARDFDCEGHAVRNRVGERMLNAEGDRGQEGGRDADHLPCRFLILIQKDDIDNISRREDVMVGKNYEIVEDKGTTKKIIIK